MQELGSKFSSLHGRKSLYHLQSALHRRTSTSGNSTNRRSCSRVGYIFLKEFVYLWTCTVQTDAVQGPYHSIVLTPQTDTTARIISSAGSGLSIQCTSSSEGSWSNFSAKGTLLLHFFFCQKRHSSSQPSENPQNHYLSFSFLFYILLITQVLSMLLSPGYVPYMSLFPIPIAAGLSQKLHPVLQAPGH